MTESSIQPIQPGQHSTRPVLEVRGLRVSFDAYRGSVEVIHRVDFEVFPGEVLGIVGESGSGKSVSVLAVMGLLPDSATVEGSARFQGREVIGAPEKELCDLRGGKISMVFQDPMTTLNPVLTVGAQIAEAVRLHQPGVSKSQAAAKAVDLLNLVGIPNAARRARQYPHEFSGGMRQRAVIAMAIANDPQVLVADEPTTALDVTVQAQILELLERIQEQTSAAIILITHDLGMVAGIADRVMVMYAGTAVETGDVHDVFDHPRHPYTLGLLRAVPRLDDTTEHLVPIPGTPPSPARPVPGCPFHVRCPFVQDICRTEVPPLRLIARGQRSACHFAESLDELSAAESRP